MPTWTIEYRDYSHIEIEQEVRALRSDPAFVRLDMTSSGLEPGGFHLEIELHPDVTMSRASAEILRRREAQAFPALPLIPSMGCRVEIRMPLGEHQDDGSLQVGLPVYLDEQGRVASQGDFLGVLTHVDRANNQARIHIQPRDPVGATPPPQTQIQRRPYPLLITDLRAHQRLCAEEDAEVFKALDTVARNAIDGIPKEPKPRPKTRYERILAFGLEKK